ncbi:MAG: peptidoglycan DD-metalloendopeptidase family protein [Candidatus Paceibacterota bacterium]
MHIDGNALTTKLNYTAILPSTQDPDPSLQRGSVKYRTQVKKTKKGRVRTLAILVFLSLPLLASAQGFFSSAQGSKLLSGEVTSGAAQNAQTLALLDARGGASSFSRGGGDVEILDISALKSRQGPSEGGGEKIAQKKSGNVSLYTVREGDSIGLIAEMFGVSSNTIIWANDVTNSIISPGETLIILPMSGVRHQVKGGDTISSIARKYGGDVDEIRDFNALSSDDSLVAGEFINIPDGEVQEIVSKPAEKSASTTSAGWLIRPISGGVKTQGIHGYNAVDLAAPAGTPVFASASGTVMTAKADGGWNGGYGNYVIIKHTNGVQTLSSHFGSVIVGASQQVVQGQIIGYIGMTGKTTGPHVHFEVRGATNPF